MDTFCQVEKKTLTYAAYIIPKKIIWFFDLIMTLQFFFAICEFNYDFLPSNSLNSKAKRLSKKLQFLAIKDGNLKSFLGTTRNLNFKFTNSHISLLTHNSQNRSSS